MKTIRTLTLLSLALAASAVALFAKTAAGPKGGRLLTTDAPHAEFFVEKDRTVVVSFYDKDLKPVAAVTQSVTAIAELKDSKVKLDFTAKNGALVSKTPLPEGDAYNIVVQVKATADAKPQNFRLKLDLATCDECKHAEYACTCEH